MPMPSRRSLALLTFAASLSPRKARPQSGWTPSRPIRIIVPLAVGRGIDVIARAIGQQIASILGQPVVIENRPGGAGIVAGQQLMAAPADGYTFLATSNDLGLDVAVRSLPFDPSRDFEPVVMMTAAPILIVVTPASVIRDVKGLIGRANAEADGLKLGTVSLSSRLAASLFASNLSIRATIIPYRAASHLIAALSSGDIDAAFESTEQLFGEVRNGELRALAAASTARIQPFEQVPTLEEESISGSNVTSWYALVARAGTPPEAILAINRAVNMALAIPSLAHSLSALGADPRGGTPNDLGQALRNIRNTQFQVGDPGNLPPPLGGGR